MKRSSKIARRSIKGIFKSLSPALLIIILIFANQQRAIAKNPAAPHQEPAQIHMYRATKKWRSRLDQVCQSVKTTGKTPKYQAVSRQYMQNLSHYSNFDVRKKHDYNNRSVLHTPTIIVLHETTSHLQSALNRFTRHNKKDKNQASYHILIGQKGNIYRLVPDDQSAFGGGDSAFNNQSVKLKKHLKPSVNNFALHVGLETPTEWLHSSHYVEYTNAQYNSLAFIIAHWMNTFSIPPKNITTHEFISFAGKQDPRNFNWNILRKKLSTYKLKCQPKNIKNH